jgi:2'-5' RNA ligase
MKDQKPQGVYAMVTPSKRDAQIISNIICAYLDGSGTKKIIDPNKYHSTLLYSRVGNVDRIKEENTDYIAQIKDIEHWTTHDDCHVLILKSPALEKRHRLLMEAHDLQWDYAEYIPHITIGYDLKVSKDLLVALKKALIGKKIILKDEEFSALDEDHSDVD